ncbi:hypothetical protein SF123566_9567 [Shigella flexneri 1235-66]|nr:hypothetical protein SF123566_9567 [Shigella flexneri 1235-66]
MSYANNAALCVALLARSRLINPPRFLRFTYLISAYFVSQ